MPHLCVPASHHPASHSSIHAALATDRGEVVVRLSRRATRRAKLGCAADSAAAASHSPGSGALAACARYVVGQTLSARHAPLACLRGRRGGGAVVGWRWGWSVVGEIRTAWAPKAEGRGVRLQFASNPRVAYKDQFTTRVHIPSIHRSSNRCVPQRVTTDRQARGRAKEIDGRWRRCPQQRPGGCAQETQTQRARRRSGCPR